MPLGRDTVAISVGFGKMVAGVEEEDWNFRAQFAGEIQK